MVLAACLMAAACSPKPQGGTGKLKVATTVTMVTDLVKQIGGDRVEIQGLMGPGVDPHNYVPKLGDAGVLEKADVVFYSGLHLEGKMVETLEAMANWVRSDYNDLAIVDFANSLVEGISSHTPANMMAGVLVCSSRCSNPMRCRLRAARALASSTSRNAVERALRRSFPALTQQLR